MVLAKKTYKELLAENKKLLSMKNPKSTTVAQTEERAIQGQPIEVFPNANIGLTREIAMKSKNGFIKDSFEVCPNSQGGVNIFGSSFVNKDGSGYRGKMNAYLTKEQKIAFCKAILEAKHIPRTDL